MAKKNQRQRSSSRDSAASSSSSSSPLTTVDSRVQQDDEQSASPPALQHSLASEAPSDSANLADVAPPPSRGNYTASEVRRQKTLFLGDAEQFAFDFGGEAAPIAETVVEDEAQQRAARRAEELESTTARMVAAAAASGPRGGGGPARPLTVEEVSQYAAELSHRGPRSFLTLPKAGVGRRGAGSGKGGSLPHDAAGPPHSSDDGAGATLAEALPQFKAALRRYDEGLWRENKKHREEEEQKRRARKRQRA